MAISKADVGWMPTAGLKAAFHPLNPNVHPDVPSLAISLLECGWIEPITLNLRNNLLVGGHHRVLAAEWLGNQAIAWFEHRASLWRSVHGDDAAALVRFTPEYWGECLTLRVDLNDEEHNAMLLRLNDTEAQGKDDPEKLRSLLAGLGDRLRALATGKEAAKPQPTAPTAASEPETEFQDKQRFERSDAIDYRVQDAPDPDTADYASGDVREYQDDDEATWQPEDEDEYEEEEERAPAAPKAPPPVHSLALAVPWSEWKRWNKWKRGRDITKDTDAYVTGHPAFAEEAIDA
jgi:hypothetical protein